MGHRSGNHARLKRSQPGRCVPGQRRGSRGWRLALLIPLLAPLLGGCGRPVPTVRLAVNSWPAYAYFGMAADRKQIDPRQLTLQLRLYSDQASQVREYIAGRADAIAITTVDAVSICGVAPDRCPVLVFVIDESRGADQLLAVPEAGGMGGLVGQPIAMEGSSLALYLVDRAFRLHSLPPPQPALRRVMPPEEWDRALRRGEVRAVMAYPPTSERLRSTLSLVPQFSSAEIPLEILDVLAVDPELLREHPGAVQGLIAAWLRAKNDERNRSESAQKELARRLGMQEAALELVQRSIRYPGLQEQYQLLDPTQNNLPPVLRRIREVLYRNGRIPASTPLPRLDPGPVLAAQQEP